MDLDDTAHRLGLSAEATAWLRGIEPRDDVPVLPADEKAGSLLARLDTSIEDRRDVLAHRPEQDPDLWWLVQRIYHEFVATMGAGVPIEGHPGHPALPDVARFVPAWTYLALVPRIRRYHRDRGISDEISWHSLAEAFGQDMRAHRRRLGVGGLGIGWTLSLRFRGADYQLGKLGFNRGAVSFGNGACGYALSTHIPAEPPLDVASCDSAFEQARAFFGRHFPEEPVTFFTCHSWLLDPQLAEYLPETSNIVRFQRRFQLLPLGPEEERRFRDDATVFGYLFDRPHRGPDVPMSLLDELPKNTTLRRAYDAHIRSGRRWHARTGWLPVDDA